MKDYIVEMRSPKNGITGTYRTTMRDETELEYALDQMRELGMEVLGWKEAAS